MDDCGHMPGCGCPALYECMTEDGDQVRLTVKGERVHLLIRNGTWGGMTTAIVARLTVQQAADVLEALRASAPEPLP